MRFFDNGNHCLLDTNSLDEFHVHNVQNMCLILLLLFLGHKKFLLVFQDQLVLHYIMHVHQHLFYIKIFDIYCLFLKENLLNFITCLIIVLLALFCYVVLMYEMLFQELLGLNQYLSNVHSQFVLQHLCQI